MDPTTLAYLQIRNISSIKNDFYTSKVVFSLLTSRLNILLFDIFASLFLDFLWNIEKHH